MVWKLKYSDDKVVPVCTANYRSPDVLLGRQLFGSDLDMWSLGCVAAELYLRRALCQPEVEKSILYERSILEAQLALLGTGAGDDDTTLACMRSLPFFDAFYGKEPG